MKMPKLEQSDREQILAEISNIGAAGQAESEGADQFRNRFCPIPEHARAFEPSVVLIVGERGSGKSELFRAVIQEKLLPEIARSAPNVMLPPMAQDRTHWLTGFPLHSEGPDYRALERTFSRHKENREIPIHLWFSYLVRVLRGFLMQDELSAVESLLKLPGGAGEENLSAFSALGDRPVIVLDDLDRRLQEKDQWIFIGYDELDTLVGPNWTFTKLGIQGLVQFWTTYSRRWKRIRPKIFLRTDLFRRSTVSLGADFPKLAANRAELSWSDKSLYTMLIKRFLNSGETLRVFCENTKGLQLSSNVALGIVPSFKSSLEAKPLIDRIAGPYMGANLKKGFTFKWVLDHVRDGQRRALPRALVRLFEYAAQIELSVPSARGKHILAPTSLRRAVDRVSQDQVQQAASDEWPWLIGLRERIGGLQVPVERRVLLKRVRSDWDGNWSQSGGDRVCPPIDDPDEFIDYLVEVGVFRFRTDSRLDAPDLYLKGLELRRKGGVKR